MSPFHAVAFALVVAQAAEAPSAPAAQPPAAAEAQTAPQPAASEVITLDDALRLAGDRNLDLKVLAAQLDQADEISWKAWARYLPQASVTGAWQAQKEITLQLEEGGPEIPIQEEHQMQGQIEVTQTLFSPAAFFGIRSAARAERAASLNIGNGRRALLFGVASAYYGVASLKEATGVSERLLEIARRQEQDARVRFQAGTIAKVGLLRAEIDRARAEQDLKRARNAFASAKVALATLLDRDADFDVAEPPSPPLAERPDTDALVRTALERRLDVQAAREQIGAARAGRTAAVGRYLPNVGAFWRYQRQDVAGLTGSADNWAAGLQLQWQILDGGLRESDIREGNARIVEAEVSARRAEARARQEVLQALLDLDSARANALKAREQRDLAAENLRLVDVSYRAGAATAVELADATAVLRNAEIAATTEGLGAQLAALRVLQVAGEFEPGAR
jgi:outer membrane protein TolC